MLKKILKNSDNYLIIDFCFLPELSIANKFSINYLVEGNDRLRFFKLSERDSISFETAKRKSDLVSKIVNYDKLQYKKVIRNENFKDIPQEIHDIISSIKGASKDE